MKLGRGLLLLVPISLIAAALVTLGSRFDMRPGAGAAIGSEGAITLQGTGATFPAPLYQKWFTEYNKAHPEVQINYQALGSGAGIKQFQQNLVDFGASDAAMTDAEMAAVKDGVVLLPMTAGTIVLAYNLPDGPSELRLSREAYVGIFLGKITQWDDPAIAKSNLGVKLPSTKITVVVRSDGSGTTFVFTSHLSAISDAWKSGPGAGKSVNFPAAVAGKGNSGVTALIKETPGAIGYVEYGYAVQTKMPMASLENKSGTYVKPDLATGQGALASVQLPANLRAWITDPTGAQAYPIVTYTWLLCYKKYKDPQKLAALKSVIEYGLTQGQTFSVDLGYIPLPPNVVDADKKALAEIS
jgi:phosphate transport system substrate-binding protein